MRQLKKLQKYTDIITGVDFVPVAIETSGVWGDQALDLVKEVGKGAASVTHKPQSTSFIRQRILVAVQRGNATCVMGTFPVTVLVIGCHRTAFDSQDAKRL